MLIPQFDLERQTQKVGVEVERAISNIIADSAFCLGPEVETLENSFAEFCEVPHAIGVNSGTSALHLCMRALDIGHGDEVITTPFTFVATSWAISYVGAKPVYVDIDPVTRNIDPKLIEEAITPRTKAIIVVHLYGYPCEMDEIMEIAERHGLYVVEDAAQAHGAVYKGKKVGSVGDLAAFSFYPSKNLGAFGEAGMITTKEEELSERLKKLRNHGSRKRYYYEELGYNYRMEGIQAAVLNVKLKYLSEWIEQRQAIANQYNEGLGETGLQLPTISSQTHQHACHQYVIFTEKRDSLMDYLKGKGVHCSLFYPVPLHLQECYKDLHYVKGSFPEAEMASEQCLGFPIFPELRGEEVDYVVGAIRDYDFV